MNGPHVADRGEPGSDAELRVTATDTVVLAVRGAETAGRLGDGGPWAPAGAAGDEE
jgi:hypothetical protein